MSHDEADDVYDVTIATFDDVTAFRNPRSGEGSANDYYYRLYDEEADTLIYATTEGDVDHKSVTMALRDGSEAGFSA